MIMIITIIIIIISISISIIVIYIAVQPGQTTTAALKNTILFSFYLPYYIAIQSDASPSAMVVDSSTIQASKYFLLAGSSLDFGIVVSNPNRSFMFLWTELWKQG